MKRSSFCLAAVWLAGVTSAPVTALELAKLSIAEINAAFGPVSSRRNDSCHRALGKDTRTDRTVSGGVFSQCVARSRAQT
jgi:hypothetical protein